MNIREINANEVHALLACVIQLSEHHNQVSVHFKGSFPSRPYEQTLFRKIWKTEHPVLPLLKTPEKLSVFARSTYTEKTANRIIWSSCPNAAAAVWANS